MWSSKNQPPGYLASATLPSSRRKTSFSSSVGALRCAPRTAIGTSHESQSRIAKRKGSVNSAYHVVVRASSQSSQGRVRGSVTEPSSPKRNWKVDSRRAAVYRRAHERGARPLRCRRGSFGGAHPACGGGSLDRE